MSEKFADAFGDLLGTFDFGDLDDDEEDDDVCADFLESLAGNINSPPGGTSPFPEPTTSIGPAPSNTPKPVPLPNTENTATPTPEPTTSNEPAPLNTQKPTAPPDTGKPEEDVNQEQDQQEGSSALSHISAVAVAVFCANIMLIV